MTMKKLCYIIKEWFFYFNHFSLIIFYHSVWLGFELFGLRVQVCSQLVQFTLMRKGYDNHHCHNKPQTENEAGVWMTSCPEELSREYWRFWKKSRQSSSDYGVEKLSSDHGVKKLSPDHGVEKLGFDHGVEKLKTDQGVEKLRLDHKMCWTLGLLLA